MRLLLALLSAASAFAQVSHVAWTVTPEASAGGKLLLARRRQNRPRLAPLLGILARRHSHLVHGRVRRRRVRVFQPPPSAPSTRTSGPTPRPSKARSPSLSKRPPRPFPAEVKIRYQTCNDTQCVPSRWSRDGLPDRRPRPRSPSPPATPKPNRPPPGRHLPRTAPTRASAPSSPSPSASASPRSSPPASSR